MKVLVLGASLNPERYSFMAINDLIDYGHSVFAVGKKEGEVSGVAISKSLPEERVHTVTVYLGAKNQAEYYSYLLELKPVRVIFNPGAENDELMDELQNKGIEVLSACTLVMLRTKQFD